MFQILKFFKNILERTNLIFVLVCFCYFAFFWLKFLRLDLSADEGLVLKNIEAFSAQSFIPGLELIRSFQDFGGLSYYLITSKLWLLPMAHEQTYRLFSLTTCFISFYIFIRLGFRFIYHNRLNPLWVSLGFLVFAVNPYVWSNAFSIHYSSFYIMCVLVSLYLFEKENWIWMSIFLCLAVLCDFTALILNFAFIYSRMTISHSKLIRIDRLASLIAPIVLASILIYFWDGLTPQGEARQMVQKIRAQGSYFSFEGFLYSLVLVPFYGFYFSWSVAIRARNAALKIGSIFTLLLVPLFFIFSNNFGSSSLGMIDQIATQLNKNYKNLILFLLFVPGSFIFSQYVLTKPLDRSKSLFCYILIFFITRFFVIQPGDLSFTQVVPFLILFALSESLVGDEGKFI